MDEPIVFQTLEELPDGNVGDSPLAADQEYAMLRAQAFSRGMAAGLTEGQQKIDCAVAALQQAEQDRAAEVAGLARRLEREALALAVALAEKLLDDHLARQPAAILPILQGVLDTLVEGDKVRVHLHPEDFTVVQNHTDEMSNPVGSEVTWQADASVARGGCYVRSAGGDIDASRESRLRHLVEALAESRQERDRDLG